MHPVFGIDCGTPHEAATWESNVAATHETYAPPAQTFNGARDIQQVTSSLNDSTHPGTLATGPSNSIQYTPWGAVSSLLNGCSGSGCAQLLETYGYNKRLQVGVAELGTSTTHAADSCRVYNYYVGVANVSACSETPSAWPQGSNNNGNAAGYYYVDHVNSGLNHAATYSYDGVNRLKTAAATGNSTYSQTFGYDAYGNMTCSASPQETKCLATTYYAATNHIVGYTYDAAGNVTSDGAYTYQWDAEARLTKVINGGGTAISTNTYNALGQRVRDATQTSTTDEAYGAGGELLWRYTGDSNTRSFVPFQGGILAEYYSGGTLFNHADELGSIATGTSYNGSACQERFFYPFGELWTAVGSCGMHQTFARLPDYDAETDQYNTPNRHYNPTGRWLSPDPAGLKAVRLDDPQTWNMYAYVRNNPTTLNDPSGLVIPEPVGGGDPNALVCLGDPSPCYPKQDDTDTNSPDAAKEQPASEKSQPTQNQNQQNQQQQQAGAAAIALSPTVEGAGATAGTTTAEAATGALTILPLVSAVALVAAADLLITNLTNTLVENYKGSEQLSAIESVVAVENNRALSMAKGQGEQRKGERGWTSKPDKPGKHARPSKEKPGQYEVKDPHTGKWIIKPPGWEPGA